MDVHSRIAANRHRLADFFDGLDPDELETPSLCDAWTVRQVLGHLVMPLVTGTGPLLLQVVRARGSVDHASEGIATRLARRPVGDLTGLLRSRADLHRWAPGVGPMGQLTDGCVHLRDCARPLGRPDDVPAEDWRRVLDWLVTGVPGLVPRRRSDGLSLAGHGPGLGVGVRGGGRRPRGGARPGALRPPGGAGRPGRAGCPAAGRADHRRRSSSLSRSLSASRSRTRAMPARLSPSSSSASTRRTRSRSSSL